MIMLINAPVLVINLIIKLLLTIMNIICLAYLIERETRSVINLLKQVDVLLHVIIVIS
jgi:hypothetical protein